MLNCLFFGDFIENMRPAGDDNGCTPITSNAIRLGALRRNRFMSRGSYPSIPFSFLKDMLKFCVFFIFCHLFEILLT